MKELLVPSAPLLLERRAEKDRRTGYKVLGVWYANQWVSLDSTRGNQEVAGLIEDGRLKELGRVTSVTTEATHGRHRYDILAETRRVRHLIEVKSCTLVEGGHARFPDAPTTRGASHMRGLRDALDEGFRCWAIFFIPRTDARVFSPNDDTDPAFGDALREAVDGGVRPLALRFGFDGRHMEFLGRVPVEL
jgi:sugar fermentation stimulation protein A